MRTRSVTHIALLVPIAVLALAANGLGTQPAQDLGARVTHAEITAGPARTGNRVGDV